MQFSQTKELLNKERKKNGNELKKKKLMQKLCNATQMLCFL